MNKIDIIKQFVVLQQFSAITRYSKDKIVNEESVLEHTGWVALFSYFIARKYLQQDPVAKIDFGELMQKAILHDIDEIFMGDIPRITKYASSEIEKEFKRLERRSVRRLVSFLDLGTGTCLIDSWSESKSEDIEGAIVVLADVAAVVYKCWQEISLSGNYSISRIVHELEHIVLPQMIDKKRRLFCPKSFLDFFLEITQHLGTILQDLNMLCSSHLSNETNSSLKEFNIGARHD